jgi:hypothetical protein
MARLGSPTLMLQQLEELSLAHTDWPEDLKSFREKKKHRRRLICERAIESRSIEMARNASVAMLLRDDIYEPAKLGYGEGTMIGDTVVG